MNPSDIPQRDTSWSRSLSYLVKRWLLRRPYLVATLPRHGLRFKVKTEDVVGRHIYKYRVHEATLTRLLARQLHFEPGDVVLDIGANIGWYSVLLERLSPAGVDVFAFEPDPLNYALLTENLALNQSRRVVATQKALADSDGVMRLYRHESSNLGRHSLLKLRDGGASVDVPTMTLDRFWTERGLGDRVPRFLKIDVEGFELRALRGAGTVLARCPAVLCEYSPAYMRRGGIEPGDLIDLFLGHEFRPYGVDGDALRPLDPDELRRRDGVSDIYWQKPAH